MNFIQLPIEIVNYSNHLFLQKQNQLYQGT